MVTVIVSSAGTSGPRGNAVLTGSGAPASNVGIDGDYYINTASYPSFAVLYGPRAAGAWPGSGITLQSVSGVLLAINNLSDVANTATARANLGLGAAAVANIGTTSGTVASGTDTRITGAAQTSNNLSDLASSSTARTNLGLGGAATLNVGTATGTVAAGDDSRITGAAQKSSNLSDLASAATARTNLGLAAIVTAKSNLTAVASPTTGADNTQGYAVGSVWVNTTSSVEYVCTNASTGAAVWTPILAVGTTAGTLAAGNDSRITGALQAGNNLSDVASASTARTNLAVPPAARQILAGTGLTGGGDLTADRTLTVAYGATAGTAAQGNDSRITGAIQSGAATGTDLTGTLPASVTVAKINGTSVPASPSTGQALIATSSTSATWQNIGLPLKSGWYYPQDGGGGSLTMTYQLMWVWPFDCQRAITLAKLAINVKTAGPADAVVRMGVYGSDGAGAIGNLIIDAGTVAAASTGVKTITISQAAGPDRLWIAAVWQGTTTTGGPVVQGYAKPLPSVGWTSYNQFPSVAGYQYTGITGALPASLGTPTGFENNIVPAIQFSPA